MKLWFMHHSAGSLYPKISREQKRENVTFSHQHQMIDLDHKVLMSNATPFAMKKGKTRGDLRAAAASKIKPKSQIQDDSIMGVSSVLLPCEFALWKR